MNAPTIRGERTLAEGVLDLKLYSPALTREVTTSLLTPKNWEPGDHGRHPVLYFLHGASDDQYSLINRTNLQRLAENSGILIVLPNCGRMGYNSDWVLPDRTGTVPRWETFHIKELLPLMESKYGASDSRMVAGVSMGGYGALRYGMRHPEMFRAIGSLSGIAHLTRKGMGALLGVLAIREGMRPGRIWGPRSKNWDNWVENDPCLHPSILASNPIYLAAGDGKRVAGDGFVMPGMGLIEHYARAMTEDLEIELRAIEADVTTSYSSGTHFWPNFRRQIDTFWPYVEKALL